MCALYTHMRVRLRVWRVYLAYVCIHSVSLIKALVKAIRT